MKLTPILLLLLTAGLLADNILRRQPYEILPEIPLPEGSRQIYGDSQELPRLTDGQIGDNWMHNTRVGWYNQGRIRIVFHLDDARPVQTIRCHVMGGGGANVFYPAAMKFTGITKDRRRVIAQTGLHPFESGGMSASGWMIIDLEKPILLKEAVIELTPKSSNVHMMADEIQFCTEENFAGKDSQDGLSALCPGVKFPASSFRLGFVFFGATSRWNPEQHMHRMKQLGFNAVHSECNTAYGNTRWKNLNPDEGIFNWRSLDLWVAGAEENELHTPIMTGIEGGIPDWVLKKFPDASFINPYGEPVPGLIDFGHPGVLSAVCRYLKEMARRYRDISCIDGYIIGDEYSIYQNYYHRKNFYGQNFNSRMSTAFQAYLKKKYRDISRLNKNFRRNYQNFQEISPSLTWILQDSFCPEWMEWCRFREKESARIYKAMADAIRSEDPTRKIALSAVSAVWPYYSVSGVNLSQLPWLDAFGVKLQTADSPAGVTHCGVPSRLFQGLGNRNKKGWVTNLSYHGLPNSESGHIRGLFELMGSGVDLITYFLWDIHGGKKTWCGNSPCFLYSDEEKQYAQTEALNCLQKIMPFVRQYGTAIAESTPVPPVLGILLPTETYHHEFRKNLTEKSLKQKKYPSHPLLNIPSYLGMNGIARYANSRNIPFQGTDYDKLKNLQAVSATGSTFLSDSALKQLEAYLKQGGLLIADAETGLYNELGLRRQRSLTEQFSSYQSQILLVNPRRIQSETPRITEFLKVRLPYSASAGGLSVLQSKNQLLLLLTNRGKFGSRLTGVQIRLSRRLLPPALFAIQAISPETNKASRISGQFENDQLIINNLSCKDALMISITFADTEQTKATSLVNTRNWWGKKQWNTRIPLRIKKFSDKTPLAAEIDLSTILKRNNIRSIPSENAVRIIRYDRNGKPICIPIVLYKDRYFNRHNCFRFTVHFNDPKPEPDCLGFYRYDMYLSPYANPSPDCKVLSSAWSENGKNTFVADGTGRQIPYAERCDGLIFPGMPSGEYQLLLVGKVVGSKLQEIKVTVNGSRFNISLTDYNRPVLLSGIQIKDTLSFTFSHYPMIRLNQFRLQKTGEVPVPYSETLPEVFIGPAEHSIDFNKCSQPSF